jgi:ketosteroid isomerase-like protein
VEGLERPTGGFGGRDQAGFAGLRRANAGRDATFAHFGQYAGESGGTFKAELHYVAADDEGCVVGVHRNTGERNGRRLDVDCCIVFDVKDGRMITAGREHFYNLHAWDEFWS